MRQPLHHLALPLLLAACSGAEPLQLIEGRLAAAEGAALPHQVVALRGRELAGAAPVEADGSFVVGVGAGTPLRLEFVDAAGGTVGVLSDTRGNPLLLPICDGAAPFALGAVALDPATCSSRCDRAEAQRELCLEEPRQRCPLRCGREICQVEWRAHERCLQSDRDVCDEARELLDDCCEAACEAMDPEERCDAEAQLVDAICACLAAPIPAIPVDPPPLPSCEAP